MATTIKSTALDVQNIKNNLKSFLESKKEFNDYNFEASGLSNLLDVLSYNTHFNALLANFALNESFLGTAQLRSSLISLAEGIGYVPDSKTSSVAYVKLSMNLSGVAGREPTITIPTGYKFTATVDEENYTFQTQETLIAGDDGNGHYIFKTTDGDVNIPIYEGTQKTKTFIADDNDNSPIYIIPDKNMDIETAVVKVYESPTSESFSTYNNIFKATTINENSRLYILKESPKGEFELSFGNGTTLGETPEVGTKIEVEYLSTNGENANTANVFEPVSTIEITDSISQSPVVSTYSNAAGGADKEDIESIRKNAPFQYASQNRMVTAADYSSLVLRNFSSLIKDIKSWGGQDNLDPEFGTVFMSVLFNDEISSEREELTKQSILDLAEQLSVASFNLKFSDPQFTYVETDVFFQFNDKLTTLSLNAIQDRVNSTIEEYFDENTGKFGRSFRRSNMLTLVDDVSPAILSSRADVRMQQRITPTLGTKLDYSLLFPVGILEPDDINYSINSTRFSVDSKTVIIRNKLNSNVLQLIDVSNNTVYIDNLGSFNPTNGTVSIVGLNVQSIDGGVDYIKISVVPSNQSAITSTLNNLILWDEGRSSSRGVLVDATE